MTDNEIIEALECCSKDDCENCPMGFGNCFSNLARCAIDLINRQQAEIESIKIENQSLRSAANSYKIHYNEARTKAVKEFEERLKERASKGFWETDAYIGVEQIEELVKEMVGEEE